MECFEVEKVIDRYIENTLNETDRATVRAHVNTCEACALLLLEMEFTLSLCRNYPELEPPPGLVKRVLQQTTGQYQSLSWMEYLLELFRPLYTSPRFATGACLAAVSLFIVMNAFGVKIRQIRWTDLAPNNVADSLNRTVNIAYDNGMRRLNDLKILYQIQSTIEELRTEVGEAPKQVQPAPKSKEKYLQNSAMEHLMAVRLDRAATDCVRPGESLLTTKRTF